MDIRRALPDRPLKQGGHQPHHGRFVRGRLGPELDLRLVLRLRLRRGLQYLGDLAAGREDHALHPLQVLFCGHDRDYRAATGHLQVVEGEDVGRVAHRDHQPVVLFVHRKRVVPAQQPLRDERHGFAIHVRLR
jgi:hypothetical protein